MNDQEKMFFEWFLPIQQLSELHDVPFTQIVNIRQIWDAGFEAGKEYA